MLKQHFLIHGILVSCFLLLVGSCKDMGNDIPPPPPQPVTVSQANVALVPGDSALVTISGGTQPYAIVSQTDTAILLAVIAHDSLKVFARSIGSSTIVIGDNGAPRLTATLAVTVTQLLVGQTSFDLLVGDSGSTTISGGRLPYMIISNSDPSKVSAVIIGSSLEIQALAAGSATLLVGDSSLPQLTVAIGVTVTAAVSFSSQVQPIFTTNCVNAGCHPGGGAPFPLAAGVSYANLVNRVATNGPCAGDLRVQPLNADASALTKRLDGTCGVQMPFGGSPLPSTQIQLIKDWINQGARNN